MLIRLSLAAGLLAVSVAPAAAAPVAREASQAADTATLDYTVAGLRVLHRPLASNDLVAANLYLLGGARQLEAATAGIEAMLLHVSEFGTERYPGREARLALARTGSRMVVRAEPDWTLFGFQGIRGDFDATWSVFADRVMRPSLDSAAVEVVRARMLRAVNSRRTHPDALIRALADSVVFDGHPYQHDPDGSAASLSRITREELAAYHAAEMATSRMLLVVVGNVSRAEVEAAIQRTLGQLPRGEYVWSLPPVWTAQRASVMAHQRSLPTNYILGYFAGPPSDSRDYASFRIATLLLGGIAAFDIRGSGLSYAAYSPFLERGASGGGVYVTTTRPDTTMRIFNSTIRFLQENTVSRPILRRYLEGFITGYYRENESNAGQADFLARHELLHGDWRLAARYMDELKRVQGTQIRRAARQYMRNIQYVYVGNTAGVPEREMTKH